jgi:DnaJ-domain-containing protein 1
MPTLFLGIIALVIVLWLLKSFAQLDPQYLIKVARTAGGILLLAGAALVGVRGELAVALPLGVTGLSLLGWMPAGTFRFWPGLSRSRGQASRVRSNFLDVVLDHDTGKMNGTILAGRFAGTPLDQLEVSTLIELLGEFDGESADLLVAYLDRRQPRWREDVEQGAATGRGSPARNSKMTPEEAYQVLGLQPGARAEDISRAHRGLMKKLHPDQGGSTYLAARVNEAKDVLLRRH